MCSTYPLHSTTNMTWPSQLLLSVRELEYWRALQADCFCNANWAGYVLCQLTDWQSCNWEECTLYVGPHAGLKALEQLQNGCSSKVQPIYTVTCTCYTPCLIISPCNFKPHIIWVWLRRRAAGSFTGLESYNYTQHSKLSVCIPPSKARPREPTLVCHLAHTYTTSKSSTTRGTTTTFVVLWEGSYLVLWACKMLWGRTEVCLRYSTRTNPLMITRQALRSICNPLVKKQFYK